MALYDLKGALFILDTFSVDQMHVLRNITPGAKKNYDSVYFQQQKNAKLKRREGSRDPSLLFSFSFFFFLIYRILIFFFLIDWSMNSEPQWTGDSKGYQKKLFLFSKRDKKKGNKVGTIYKVGTLLYISVF